MFYEAREDRLRNDIATMLADASAEPLRPKALIVPHAGYVYSGPIAASAYALLRPWRTAIRRVVLFGPAHRVAVAGMALPTAEAFATPLGQVTVDAAAVQIGLGLPHTCQSDRAHAEEHALEVQLPFLQSVLDDFAIVPILVGHAAVDAVATAIDALWGDAETLVVISSDLSHYHAYAEARTIDSATAAAVLALQPLTSHEQACGAMPVNALLAVARRRGLQARLLDLRNSGDTAGDRSRVVGYAAFAFSEPLQVADHVH
jgi:AmmeMemoRadiSam system protein B